MNSATESSIDFVISFQGLLADQGSMPLEDVLRSLGGWQDFIQMTVATYAEKKLSSEPLLPPLKPRIQISVPRAGSWEATLVLAVTAGYIARHLPAPNVLLSKVKKLFKHHLEQKRLPRNVSEVVAALEELASQEQIEIPSKPEVYQLVIATDEALKKATEPIEYSASVIEISTAGEPILRITGVDKRNLNSGFHFTARDEVFFNATIRLVELNLQTGHTTVVVQQSDNPLFGGKTNCYVLDKPSLHHPRNAYTEALSGQVDLSVSVKPCFNPKTGVVQKWLLQAEPPQTIISQVGQRVLEL